MTLEEGFDDVVGAARNGEEWGLRAVYEALAPQVRGYLRAQGEAQPDELLGDVFLQVVRDFASFRGDESALRAWVLKIAHQRLVNPPARRSGGPSEYVLAGESGAGAMLQDADETALEASKQARVNTRLTGLSSDQRSVVLLRAVGDLTVEQVGAVLGKRRRAVKRLQRQGLAALARHKDIRTNTEEPAHHKPGELELDAGQLAEGSADELTRRLESVAERARGLKRESESILHGVERAIERVRSAAAARPSPRPPTVAGTGRGIEGSGSTAFAADPEGERPADRRLERQDADDAGPASQRNAEPPPGAGAEEALLRATQMAIRGDGRAEIEAMLSDEFGVASPADIVDQILGVGRE